MKNLTEELIQIALDRGWELSKLSFAAHPFLFWTKFGGIAKYNPKDVAMGDRGSIEYKGVEIPFRVSVVYQKGLVILFKDQKTTSQHVSKMYDEKSS